ncbi:hypothetical protein PYCCODRAFT_1394926 [Trametes coccinea BRFM310]|uniref:Uncharacterized protein n=1 Tax=Trametes coccinea (strain BRFM310) TaxID=1353009 RepID=A0A1Y2IG76_TRAC3|nr:hypothetical protein PYCCODRAFT_1394926 [Trametes coccinea BRFM310]
MAHFPNAPQLPPTALREVFTYPDPTRALDERNPYSDAGRLELQGEKMAEAAYLDSMFNNGFNDLLERAARAYRWSQRVQGYPPNFDRDSPEEARRLFCVYAGAVKVEHGYEALKRWMAEWQ